MTFRTASRSRATQRQAKRASDEGTKPAPWAVVAFRRGRTNRGKPCVYRRCWPFRDGAKARVKYLTEAQNYAVRYGLGGFVALVTASTLEGRGHEPVANAWVRQRKGVNRDADPYLSGTYMHRELRGDRSFSEEGRR